MNCIDTKTPAGCDQQGRYETRDWGRSGSGVSMIPSLAHDEASWARASRSVGPVVTPCKPLPLLTRWGMWLSQWFNWKV